MSKATAKSKPAAPKAAPKSTAKKGQKSKAAAPVVAARPKAKAGFTVLAKNLSAAKAGAKPSTYYPQGDVTLCLAAKSSNMGKDQQSNWDAIAAALGGKPTGQLSKALAKSNKAACTRRHVRRLARAGFLSWK